ncbi:MAG: LuxR C-terminal-related transcriptional regulator [Anaerolineae bacterium]|nr:LuxR C-terminal-related transcriptional regulator [Thermoflexales bacterium]MDW8408252.1 LuxR C-terminal-related transcriptional regulator [Anaerolineae bacterium]
MSTDSPTPALDTFLQAALDAVGDVIVRAIERLDRALAELPPDTAGAHEINVARQLLESAARIAHQAQQADALSDAGDGAPRQNNEDYLPPMPPLTAREEEVLRLMAQGLRNKEIAARLGISERTATFHVGNVLSKLGADGRVEAVHLAKRRRLL